LYKQVLCFNVICQPVTPVSPAERAETIKLPFAFRTWVGPINHVLHEVQMPTWEATILRAKQANHIGTLCGHLCKHGEPIEVPFRLWARMGPKHHVLHGRSRSPVGWAVL